MEKNNVTRPPTKFFLLLLICLGLAAAGVLMLTPNNSASTDLATTRAIAPDGFVYELEVAQTGSELSHGLMYRESVCERCGMLFVLAPGIPMIFWMKNMQFPTDLLFIDSKGNVLDVFENCPPCVDNCIVYTAPASSSFALELPAFSAKQHGLVKGANLSIAGLN